MHRLLVTVLALAAVGCGCGERDVESSEETVVAREAAPRPAPAVLFTGCEAVTVGPVCYLRPQAELHLWAEVHRDARLALEIDGEPWPVTWTTAADGLRTRVMPPTPEGTLALRDLDDGWQWVLALAPVEAPMAAFEPAHRLRAEKRFDDAASELETALRGLSGPARAEGLKLRGDFASADNRLVEAERAYEDAFAALSAEGRLKSASDVALSAFYIHYAETQDQEAAQRWLTSQAELIAEFPQAGMEHHYYAGLLAELRGDVRAARRSYEEGARLARALDHPEELAASLSMLAALYANVGDHARAADALAEAGMLGDALSPQNRNRLRNNAGWVALLALDRGVPADDPEPHFAASLEQFTASNDRVGIAETRLNLAYVALLRGDVAAAKAALAPLVPPNRGVEREQRLLEGRIALLEARAEVALRRFEAVARAAADAANRPHEWAAAVGAGEALEALGRVAEAEARYARAIHLHRMQIRSLGASGGRERFAAAGDRGAQRLVRLLLAQGRVETAACVARRARGQAFAGLAAAARDPAALARHATARDALAAAVERTWERPRRVGDQERARLRAHSRELDDALDELLAGGSGGEAAADVEDRCADLRAPAVDELLLVYYPVDRGHAAFAIDASGVRGELGTEPLAGEPVARAEQLLGPFADALARARRVRVVASGTLAAEAFHALPWAGAPLVERVAISYALDLPRADRVATLRRAVILAPPTSNLAGAPAEQAAAERALRAHGVAVEVLTGDELDLRRRLGDADLMHFLGHARGDGWQGALELGGERRLTPADLLSGAAPAIVVLSGCETGLPDPTAHAGGMSLAHALLLAGSSAVIATDATVRDELAAELTPAVIAAIAAGEEPAEALRAAQRAYVGAADWARFRVFVP